MTRETAAIQDFLLEESRASRIPGTDEVAQDLLSTLRADSVVAVLFYGSCLRTGDVKDKILDFYLVVENYKKAYGWGWKAIANKLIPPNVFYRETMTSQGVMRSKYAIISEQDLKYGTSQKCLNVSLWARFSQPIQILYLRKPDDKATILECLAQAPITLLGNILPLMPERFTVADLWGQAFTATYNAELRSEKAGKGIEIYDLYADRYQQMMPLLYRHFPFLSPYPVQSRRQKVAQKTENLEYFAPKKQRERKRKRTQALWLLRRIQGKCLTIARLLKATSTFEGD